MGCTTRVGSLLRQSGVGSPPSLPRPGLDRQIHQRHLLFEPIMRHISQMIVVLEARLRTPHWHAGAGNSAHFEPGMAVCLSLSFAALASTATGKRAPSCARPRACLLRPASQSLHTGAHHQAWIHLVYSTFQGSSFSRNGRRIARRCLVSTLVSVRLGFAHRDECRIVIMCIRPKESAERQWVHPLRPNVFKAR
ncbi:hypothetical protein FKP32DRAFT_1177618 [Trametes sanguinea]|nr:hypothetical protein FKP32DRAFT_1177618 [Trametes sanguinea]